MNMLQDRLDRGDIILMNGGTGTEIERRGGKVNAAAWSAESLLTHPDIVRAVHQTYIEAGAEIIIANTFSTSRHLLEAAGLEDHFEEINHRGVQLVIEAQERAAKHPVVIAGSISTTTMGRSQPPRDTARRNFSDQARILADAGAQIIILEMMRDVEYTNYALEGALETGLPIWAAFSARRGDDGRMMLVDGKTPLSEGIEALGSRTIQAAGIMHTLTEDIADCLDVMEGRWKGPTTVYAHSGVFEMPNWRFTDIISPWEYAEHALGWVERGVQAVGGCCGIGPDHIDVLKTKLPAKLPTKFE